MSTETLHPADVMLEAAGAARNDEILEVVTTIFELLAERVENAVELAIESSDRDALNEAYTFATRADELFPWTLGAVPARVRSASRLVDDAKREIAGELDSTRATTAGPAPQPRRVKPQTMRQVHPEKRYVNRLDLSPDRVRAVLAEVAVSGPVAVSDIVASITAGTRIKPRSNGWRCVVARVTHVLRVEAAAGNVTQHRPQDSRAGRVTCRWEVAPGRAA